MLICPLGHFKHTRCFNISHVTLLYGVTTGPESALPQMIPAHAALYVPQNGWPLCRYAVIGGAHQVGTTGWTAADVVLEVPREATEPHFGLGGGTVPGMTMAPSIALARDIPGTSTMDGVIDTPGACPGGRPRGPAPGAGHSRERHDRAHLAITPPMAMNHGRATGQTQTARGLGGGAELIKGAGYTAIIGTRWGSPHHCIMMR